MFIQTDFSFLNIGWTRTFKPIHMKGYFHKGKNGSNRTQIWLGNDNYSMFTA